MRQQCFERYNHRCAHCDLKDGWEGWRKRDGTFVRVKLTKAAKPYYTGRKLLTVQLGAAHINHTPGDDRQDNLIALCRRCHLIFDAPHHRETRSLRKDADRPILRYLNRAEAWGKEFEALQRAE